LLYKKTGKKDGNIDKIIITNEPNFDKINRLIWYPPTLYGCPRDRIVVGCTTTCGISAYHRYNIMW